MLRGGGGCFAGRVHVIGSWRALSLTGANLNGACTGWVGFDVVFARLWLPWLALLRLAYNELGVEGGGKVAAALAECQPPTEVKSAFFSVFFRRTPQKIIITCVKIIFGTRFFSAKKHFRISILFYFDVSIYDYSRYALTLDLPRV